MNKFLTVVGQLKFRGTSVLFRLPQSPIKHQSDPYSNPNRPSCPSPCPSPVHMRITPQIKIEGTKDELKDADSSDDEKMEVSEPANLRKFFYCLHYLYSLLVFAFNTVSQQCIQYFSVNIFKSNIYCFCIDKHHRYSDSFKMSPYIQDNATSQSDGFTIATHSVKVLDVILVAYTIKYFSFVSGSS